MYPAGRAGGDRAPKPGNRGSFEKAGEAISFGIFLFSPELGKFLPQVFCSHGRTCWLMPRAGFHEMFYRMSSSPSLSLSHLACP